MANDKDVEHLQWLSRIINEKRKEYEDVQSKIMALEDRADEMRKGLEDLIGARNLVLRTRGEQTPAFGPFEFRAMTVGNAAYEILSNRGGSMKISEILKLLQDGGKQFRSEKPASVVQTALDRDGRFKKVRSSIYKLRDESSVVVRQREDDG